MLNNAKELRVNLVVSYQGILDYLKSKFSKDRYDISIESLLYKKESGSKLIMGLVHKNTSTEFQFMFSGSGFMSFTIAHVGFHTEQAFGKAINKKNSWLYTLLHSTVVVRKQDCLEDEINKGEYCVFDLIHAHKVFPGNDFNIETCIGAVKEFCEKVTIPTLFWNKEHPMFPLFGTFHVEAEKEYNYGRFIPGEHDYNKHSIIILTPENRDHKIELFHQIEHAISKRSP